jgi:hypothetical protein
MLCPVCETNCSQVSPDLFDCDVCEMRWVLETDPDTKVSYLESEEVSNSRVTRRDFVLLGMGAVVGVFSGVIGEILAELFLDKLRLRHAKQYEPLLEPESETPQ